METAAGAVYASGKGAAEAAEAAEEVTGAAEAAESRIGGTVEGTETAGAKAAQVAKDVAFSEEEGISAAAASTAGNGAEKGRHTFLDVGATTADVPAAVVAARGRGRQRAAGCSSSPA